MTIVEEIDKKSNRPHRSKNIVDAMKYANNIASTPQNIAEAVKKSQSSGGGGYMGMESVQIPITVKSLPGEGATLTKVEEQWTITTSDGAYLSGSYIESPSVSLIEIPLMDGADHTSVYLQGTIEAPDDSGGLVVVDTTTSEFTGDIEVVEGQICISGPGTMNLDWYYSD